jgi:putative (di)nucleoside polyphosphate hydrolase
MVAIEPLADTPLAAASAARAARDEPLPPHLAAYRRNVSVLLVSPRTRRAFCATRVDDPHRTWQCPQGGVDRGETALAAALRELQEETNVTSVRVVGATSWLHYDFPDWVRERLHPAMRKYKGQAQRWYLMLYTGDARRRDDNEQVAADGGAAAAAAAAAEEEETEGCAEADLSGGGQHHREFSGWAWRPLARLPLDVSEFKKGVYAAAAAELGAVLDELEAAGALRRVAAEADAAAAAAAEGR